MTSDWGNPPCGHTQYTRGCIVCTQWAYHPPELRQKLEAYHNAHRVIPTMTNPEQIREAIAKRYGKRLKEGPIVRHSVTIPARAERIALPVRTPCKYEGAVMISCRACNDGFKVRHCEHPNADWDFCARMATPREHGMNCQQCNLYQAQGT